MCSLVYLPFDQCMDIYILPLWSVCSLVHVLFGLSCHLVCAFFLFGLCIIWPSCLLVCAFFLFDLCIIWPSCLLVCAFFLFGLCTFWSVCSLVCVILWLICLLVYVCVYSSSPEGRPGISDVSPRSGISGLSV